jgi:Double-GTPase 2
MSTTHEREEMRARVCPECEYPLPQDIDDRKPVVIAVVGVNRVGKTNFIAACLNEAYRQRGLSPLGCTEFVPDDATSTLFQDHYYRPLFRDGTVLDVSQNTEEVRFRPLVFNVTLAGREPFSLIVHDIAGEALADPRIRARAATFLRAARGVIFVIDPREIDDIREQLPAAVVNDGNQLGFDQSALLANCLRPNGLIEDGRIVPVALTMAKADLLSSDGPKKPTFLGPATPSSEGLGSFIARVKATSGDVRAFLEERGAHDLVTSVRTYQDRCAAAAEHAENPSSIGTITCHAVSALGSQPTDAGEVAGKVRPLNCVDPLATVLAQVCELSRPASSEPDVERRFGTLSARKRLSTLIGDWR